MRPPVKLIILKDVIDDIIFMAESTYPNEFLAFLNGVVKNDDANEDPVAFIDGLSILSFKANNHSANFNFWDLPIVHGVIGTVHSHPSGSTKPSKADLRLFSKLGWCHIIVGYPFSKDRFAVYDKLGRSFLWSIKD